MGKRVYDAFPADGFLELRADVMGKPVIRSLLFVPGRQREADPEGAGVGGGCGDPRSRGRGRAREQGARPRRDGGGPRRRRRGTASRCSSRLNAFDTGLTAGDLAAVLHGRPWGVVLPKCNGAADVERLSHYLEALEAREDVAARRYPDPDRGDRDGRGDARPRPAREPAPRTALWGMLWGGEDLSATLGADQQPRRERRLHASLPVRAVAVPLCRERARGDRGRRGLYRLPRSRGPRARGAARRFATASPPRRRSIRRRSR